MPDFPGKEGLWRVLEMLGIGGGGGNATPTPTPTPDPNEVPEPWKMWYMERYGLKEVPNDMTKAKMRQLMEGAKAADEAEGRESDIPDFDSDEYLDEASQYRLTGQVRDRMERLGGRRTPTPTPRRR